MLDYVTLAEFFFRSVIAKKKKKLDQCFKIVTFLVQWRFRGGHRPTGPYVFCIRFRQKAPMPEVGSSLMRNPVPATVVIFDVTKFSPYQCYIIYSQCFDILMLALFTLNNCDCKNDDANNWVPLISMELFASNDTMYQKKSSVHFC